MPKFAVGDTTYLSNRRGKTTVIAKITGWRGGGVAPYVCEIIKSDDYFYKVGAVHYFPGRDMELLEMQGKKKIYCCVPNCSTYSFESKGTVQWQCDKHCEFSAPAYQNPTLEEKVDLILEHLGLEISIEPQKVVLKEVVEPEKP